MRRLLICGFLQAVALAQPFGNAAATLQVGTPEYTAKLIKFNESYGRYFRDYFGCPAHAAYSTECTLGEQTINYADLLKASKLAPEVFPQLR